jgi:hypothetical protein
MIKSAFIFFAILLVSTINTKGILNTIKKTITNLVVKNYKKYCNDYYNFVYYVEDGDLKLHSCNGLDLYYYDANPNKVDINCDKFDSTLVDSDVKKLKTFAYKNLGLGADLTNYVPFQVVTDILDKMTCNGDYSKLVKLYPNLSLQEKGPTLVVSDSTKVLGASYQKDKDNQFFDYDTKVYHQKFDERINLKFIVDQLNLGNNLYKKYQQYDDLTIELSNNDLTIKRVKNFYRNFIIGTVHEMLAVCAVNKSGAAYYFVFQRLGEDELDSVFKTKIQIIYYAKSNNCDENSSKWPDKISKYSFIKSSSKEISVSMANLIQASYKYYKNFPDYWFWKSNCQHYATGMYNALTGEKTNPTNLDKMENAYRHPNFSSYF